jgi:LysM repeat protein
MSELVDPDNFTIDIFKQRKVYMRNRIKYIEVIEGDTYQKLTKELELMPWQLAKYNDIERGAKLKVGQELFIQPKRRKAEANHTLHIVEAGETMPMISQMYGIRLKSLYSRNRVDKNHEPEPGEKIYLRGRRPKDK